MPTTHPDLSVLCGEVEWRVGVEVGKVEGDVLEGHSHMMSALKGGEGV